MKNIIIAHGEDLDGIVSHTLLEMHAPESTHILARYGSLEADFESVLSMVKDNPGTNQVYVADISFGESLFKVVDNISQLTPVTWIDHHDPTFRNLKHLLKNPQNTVTHNPSLCSSQLVGLRYLLHSDYVGYLTDLAQRSDYPDKFKQTGVGRKLEKVIAVLNYNRDDATLITFIRDLKEEGRVILNSKNLSSSGEERVKEYDLLESDALNCLGDNGRVYTIGKNRVMFSYTSPIIPGKQATRVLRDNFSDQADMFVVLFNSPSKNHWIIRKETCSFPVVELCEYLGGGGRGKGGGFPWSEAVTAENYVRVSDSIAQKMGKSDYFK